MHKTNYSKGGIYSTFQQAQGQLSLLYYFILKSVKKKESSNQATLSVSTKKQIQEQKN